MRRAASTLADGEAPGRSATPTPAGCGTSTPKAARRVRLVGMLLRASGGALAYADFVERALLNGVLGTQRGPSGAMLYFMPLGSGMSKRPRLAAHRLVDARWRLLVLPGHGHRSVRASSGAYLHGARAVDNAPPSIRLAADPRQAAVAACRPRAIAGGGPARRSPPRCSGQSHAACHQGGASGRAPRHLPRALVGRRADGHAAARPAALERRPRRGGARR